MPRTRVGLLLALAGFAVCCSESNKEPAVDAGSGGSAGSAVCELDFLGDPEQPPKLELTFKSGQHVDAPVSSLNDGDMVPILASLAGGFVLLVGVRATNIDPCFLQLRGTLRDPVSGESRTDVRTVRLQPTGDGWGQSPPTDFSAFANIPACPNQWADRDLYDQVFELTVSLAQKGVAMASMTLNVTPTCAEPDTPDWPVHTQCLCLCKRGYLLGESCEGGGGAGGSAGGPAGRGGAGGSGGV